MSNIIIKMRSGETKYFKHVGRSGGSYTKEIRYEGSFAIVTDEYGKETAIPQELIEEVKTEPTRW